MPHTTLTVSTTHDDGSLTQTIYANVTPVQVIGPPDVVAFVVRPNGVPTLDELLGGEDA